MATPRVALITGGGRGIGLACARAFARGGFHIVIAGRDQARLQSPTAELETLKATTVAVPFDVSDSGFVEGVLGEIGKRFSSIEVFMNNAGMAHGGSTVENLPLSIWKQVIDTNLT